MIVPLSGWPLKFDLRILRLLKNMITMTENLPFYIHCFSKLKRDMKNGGAPHKPILLLAVIRLFQQGIYSNSQLPIVPELVASFKTIWSQLVVTRHDPIFALPFYHMRSESFWNLVANPGCEIWIESKSSMRSFANLTTAVRFAELDDSLASILLTPEGREILKDTLLETYFPDTRDGYVESGGDDLPNGNVLNESPNEYKRKLAELKNRLNNEAFQEEVFVRGGIFKREIPKIYNNTCAISGMRVDALLSISMVDACHIVPFSEGYDDTLVNGIALCPNLHRAFDRGLISISDDYRVLLKKNFVENRESPFNLGQFEGAQISLPADPVHFPALENIAQHRKKFGFY